MAEEVYLHERERESGGVVWRGGEPHQAGLPTTGSLRRQVSLATNGTVSVPVCLAGPVVVGVPGLQTRPNTVLLPVVSPLGPPSCEGANVEPVSVFHAMFSEFLVVKRSCK